MRKSEELNNAALSRIAISAILVASFIFAGSEFTQQTLAIHERNATGTTTLTQSQLAGGGGGSDNATTTTAQSQLTGGTAAQNQTGGGTAATPTTTAQSQLTGGTATQNQTGGGTAATPATTAQSQLTGVTATQNQTGGGTAATPTTTMKRITDKAGMQEPPMNRPFTWQGTVSSEPRSIEGTEDEEQVAMILPPRNDGGVYSGVLTFSSSKPIQIEVWHEYDPGNTTDIPEAFGTEQIVSSSGKEYATSLIEPGTEGAATVPFSGNALALNGGGEVFIATYSLTAGATQPRTINNVESIATVAAEEEAAGDEEAGGAGAAGDEEAGGAGAAGDEEAGGAGAAG